jgi:integrase
VSPIPLSVLQTDRPTPCPLGAGGVGGSYRHPFFGGHGSRHGAPADDRLEFNHPGLPVQCAVGNPPPGRLTVPEGSTQMASLSRDANGNYTVQVVCGDSKRRSIRLGKVNKKIATEVKLKVEHLNALAVAKLPMDTETAQWVATIGDELAAKLAAVGLIPPRESRTLRQFLDDYIGGRAGDGHTKPATVINIRRVADDLTAVLGPGADVRSVTVADAERFKGFYQKKELAPATTYRRLKMAKMLFNHAVKLKLVTENPFADVKGKNTNPVERRHYVSEADTLKLLEAANPTWRAVIALARFGGLRCPSEVLSLKWENVDFATGRMTVSSPKTEHLEGRAYRIVPLFARLRPYLEDAHELAAPGEVYVVGGLQGAGYRAAARTPGGWMNANLRTTFEKLIRRAGLQSWPRLFHNMRASCETDLMQNHPIHVVTAWIGNTPKIALGHYLQTLDADFEKALRGGPGTGAIVVQKAVQSGAAERSQEMMGTPETLEKAAPGVPSQLPTSTEQEDRWPRWDLNPPTSGPGIDSESQLLTELTGAESGAVLAAAHREASDSSPSHPPSALVTALLALAQQLSSADRATLARLLMAPGTPKGDAS